MISYSDLDNLEQRLCDLICEYDSLNYHICPYIERKYVLEFGLDEYELYRLDLEIEKLNRKIQLINENVSDYDEIANKEFKEYFYQLEAQMDEVNYFKNDDFNELSLEEFNHLNEVYLLLISNLHFDIHASQSFLERAWCIRAMNAFKNLDLNNLELLVETISSEELSPVSKIKDFEKIIMDFEGSIAGVKDDYPFNKARLIFDDVEKDDYHIMLNELKSQRVQEKIFLESKIDRLTS